MKILHLFSALGLVVAVSGCGIVKLHTSTLHVHEGPLAESHPGLAMDVRSKWTNNEGSIAYTLPDGVTCSGNWSLAKGRAPKSNVNAAMLTRGSGWIANGGGISTTGDGSARVDHGNRQGLGIGSGACGDGTTFNFIFVADGLHAKGGVADSKGNLFRLVR